MGRPGQAVQDSSLNLLGGYKALDLVRTCQRYAAVGEQAVKAKNERIPKPYIYIGG